MSAQTNIDEELQAYADGQLSTERRQAFEQVLARDPALAARAAFVLASTR